MAAPKSAGTAARAGYPALIATYYFSIFTLDVLGNLYIGIMYLVPVIFLFFMMIRYILVISLFGIALLGIAGFLSPETGGHMSATLVDRGSAALIICIAMWLAIRHREKMVALRRNDAALDALSEIVPLGHYRLRLDSPDGCWQFSPECLEIAGTEKPRGAGIRALARLVHPQDRHRVLRQFRRAWLEAEGYDVEFRVARPDGELRHVRTIGRFHRKLRGVPRRLTGTLFDISDWRRTERDRDESEARMKSILDSVFDALIIVDRHGRIESFSASAETLFGYRSAEVVGKSVEILLTPDHRMAPMLAVEQLAHGGDRGEVVRRGPVSAFRKDGSTLNVALAVSAIRFAGEPRHIIFVHDLTESQMLEEELRQSQKMDAIGQLAGGIAHDFNNLLTVIIGNLEMLERKPKSRSAALLIREARETAELGAGLTERLLAFGRRRPLNATCVDLPAIMSEMIAVLQRTLGEFVHIGLECEPGLPAVLLDPSQLQVALLNLALNAREAMPRGGTLDITLGRVDIVRDPAAHEGVPPGHYVLLSVEDNGSGMSEETRKRALEPFFTTRKGGKGTGLGLSMVYVYMKQIGGHMTLESRLGEGTTVKLYLPCAPEGSRAEPVKPRGASKPLSGRGQRILVVEDDTRVRRLTATRLRQLGYEAVEAGSAREALETLARLQDVKLMLSDNVMPGGVSGTELALAVRDMRPDIGIVLTTGYARPPEDPRHRDGDVIWLPKPYRTDDLARTIRGALDEGSERPRPAGGSGRKPRARPAQRAPESAGTTGGRGGRSSR